ncbi:hydrolase, TatD family protein [Chlamydia ibidis]|uniref:Hydrolase, TatD family protein n=2 Tax=Chlamydia ibidis TaxID=1405396 RepID=S7KEH5_9CHLA|nr:TatD family hydrolase [Chlamydia ibidis]EPP34601.1 hydrolase, TatD family protein [Chlamydia ibidis]EQM62869.1 hydrolase, TatD family protein [Chlamydia ibidis 10-1398/6]
MAIFDAHVHLSDEAFCEDIDQVLKRAQDADVSLVVNVTTTAEELNRSFAYADRFSDIRFCHVAGTPPQDAHLDIEEDFRYFYELAHAGKLSAIGEVGLDYGFAKNQEAVDRQHDVLKRYFNLALDCQLPLVVHCRGAFSDFFRMLDLYYHNDSRSQPGMLHCFTGSLEEAKELISKGWYLSISGIVTFKNAEDLRNVVAEIPEEHLLIETDAPFLAPTPHRGKKNEPAYITRTIDTIGTIKGYNRNDLLSIVCGNLHRFLNHC